jgi:uncharacterized protein
MADPGSGFVAGQYPIDAYGNGGFRFAGMSHRGSVLALPSGIQAWPVSEPRDIDIGTLAPLLALSKGQVELLLVGTGVDLVPVPPKLRARLREAGIVTEPMATGAAARTYNILLAEGRRVAAALIAVA